MEDGTYKTYTPTGTRKQGGAKIGNSVGHQAIDYKNGYQVGMVEGTWLKIHSTHKAFNQESIINSLLECALETQAPFVGVWTDKKTDIIHIDPSKYIYHRINAVQMAEENNQLSIWDWENMEEILKADW